jgi:hypothetical protein
MIPRKLLKGTMVLVVMTAHISESQSSRPPKVALNEAKPIVYIEFDHAGPREPIEAGEPKLGLWLRLVNNSVVPIDVETMNTATKSGLLLVPDFITPIQRKIPRSGPSQEQLPTGYAPGLGTVQTIAPGKDLVFSVPANHLSPNWFMQVPFQFSLPPVKEGEQPLCYAVFTWEDLPQSYRDPKGERLQEDGAESGAMLMHESVHADPPKP